MFDAVNDRPLPLIPLWMRSFADGEKCALCAEHTTGGDDVICHACLEKLSSETEWFCARCGAQIRDCICVPPLMRKAGVDAYVKLFPYFSDDVLKSNRIIYRLKTRRDGLLALRVTAELADSILTLTKAAGCEPGNAIVSYIPRSKRRLRENGTDQARSLAKALAAQCKFRCEPLFVRNGSDVLQKTLGSTERSANVNGKFSLRSDADVKDACVVLIDDLVTTGSSIAGCAMLLKRAGAKNVFCASLAHTAGVNAEYFSL